MFFNGFSRCRQLLHLVFVGSQHGREVAEITIAPETLVEVAGADGVLLEPAETRGDLFGLGFGQIGLRQVQLVEHLVNFVQGFHLFVVDPLDVLTSGFKELRVFGLVVTIGVAEQRFAAVDGLGEIGVGAAAHAEGRRRSG